MLDKQFLIIDEKENDIEGTLEQRVIEFIKLTFGELLLDKISFEIDSYILREPLWTDGMNIKINFNDFKYFNKVHGECVESIWMTLEDKGLKPFYIDGKFISLLVFEWVEAIPIQKAEFVYGIHKDKIYKDFGNFILTC